MSDASTFFLQYGGYAAAVVGILAAGVSVAKVVKVSGSISAMRSTGELSEFYSRQGLCGITYRTLFWAACFFTVVSLGASIWSLTSIGVAEWTTWCSVVSALLSLVFLNIIREGPRVTAVNDPAAQGVTPHGTVADPTMMEVPIDDTVTQQIGKQVDAVGNKAFSSGIGAGAKVHKVAHNTGHSVADKLAIGAAVATVVAASVFNGVVTTAISTSRAATFAAGGSTDACAFIQSSGDMSISSACCGAVVNYQSQWQDCYNSVSNWESLVPDNDLTISNCVQQAENTWVSLSDATLQQTAYFDGQVLKCIGPYVSSECSTLGQLLVSNCA